MEGFSFSLLCAKCWLPHTAKNHLEFFLMKYWEALLEQKRRQTILKLWSILSSLIINEVTSYIITILSSPRLHVETSKHILKVFLVRYWKASLEQWRRQKILKLWSILSSPMINEVTRYIMTILSLPRLRVETSKHILEVFLVRYWKAFLEQ